MINISSLNKIYRSKKRKKCHALKNINLSLSDTGLVFVLGKSGSGKSTLLNLIGGLDNISSGKIVVNGNDLSRFSENDFCNYRNTHIGFIFQDYHLINEITVYENIAISLRLNNDINEKEKIAYALERVGLSGYESRYPQELSGGEQQRVAIARALVKQPRIILADEPTGNLDFATSKSIMEILKELSRECLILIVSHNVGDANLYADRIIELASGEIISDKTKNPDFPNKLTLCGKSLLYPDNSPLSDDDIDLINENSDKTIVKRSDKFIDTKKSNDKGRRVFISNKRLAFSHKASLSANFLRHKHFKILFASFMIAVIMVIMSLAQTIMVFDGNAMIENEMKKAGLDSLYLEKQLPDEIDDVLDADVRSEIGKNDIQKIKDSGYNGKVYPVYNVNVPVRTNRHAIGFNGTFYDNILYIKESLGTMVVDEEFFKEKFGKVNYLATVDAPKDYGLIITDYVADAILATSKNHIGKTYKDILGAYLPLGWSYDSIYINAVIDTGYKTKHKELVDKLVRGEINDLHSLDNDKTLLDFMTDVYDSIGFSYSLAPNFQEIAYLTRPFYSTGKLVFNNSIEFNPNIPSYISFIELPVAMTLNKGEISFSRAKYNEIFGTNYEVNTMKDFVPHKVTVSCYKLYDVENENKLFTFELTIASLHNHSDMILFHPEKSEEYKKIIGTSDTYAYSLYIDGAENIEEMLDFVDDENYSIQGHIIDGVRTMTKAVDVFVPIFELIAAIICLGVVLIMLNFASKMINDKMHDIGILKALGAKNSTIGSVFGIQVFLIAVFTSILSVAGYFFFIDIANNVLFQSLKRLAPSQVVLDLDFLTFKPFIAIINCILTFVLALISLILPLVKIKNIKPVKIIKAKE